MSESKEPRLTTTVSGAGWASKLAPGDLERALSGLEFPSDPDVMVGLDRPDDAGVYKISDELALIQTGDFFYTHCGWPLLVRPDRGGQRLKRCLCHGRHAQNRHALGIYQILNLVNGKLFIGKSADLNGKINIEKFQLKNNMHMNSELQNDFNNLGEGKIIFEILDRLQPKEEQDYDYSGDLRILEEMWLCVSKNLLIILFIQHKMFLR